MHDIEEKTAKKEMERSQFADLRPVLMGQVAGAVKVLYFLKMRG